MSEEERRKKKKRNAASRNQIFRAASAAKAGEEAKSAKTVRHTGAKVGRNDPCPCGSGKKYKKCHGA